MIDFEEIKSRAAEKVRLFLELNNREHPLQQELRWGPYVVYRYLHSEEYLEEVVTFEDKEEAEVYLQSILDEWAADPDRDNEPWGDEEPDDEVRAWSSIKAWDEPIRRGIHRFNCETVGLANPKEFVNSMPTEFALMFLVGLFNSALIPGYYEEH